MHLLEERLELLEKQVELLTNNISENRPVENIENSGVVPVQNIPLENVKNLDNIIITPPKNIENLGDNFKVNNKNLNSLVLTESIEGMVDLLHVISKSLEELKKEVKNVNNLATIAYEKVQQL